MDQPSPFTFLKYWPLLWLGLWFSAAFGSLTLEHSSELSMNLYSPSLDSWLGYDAFGRHLLPLTLKASLVSSGFAIVAVVSSSLLALGMGSVLSLWKNPFTNFGLRFLDLFLAFPYLVIALAWAAVRGPGWDTLLIALWLSVLPSLTRWTVIQSRELLEEDFILASKSLGAKSKRLMTRHLVPHLIDYYWIKFPNLFAAALTAEATLSFLGIGVPIGRDSWGSLLAQGKDYLLEAPHISFSVGIPLVLTILALQILSERLALKRG